MANFAVVLAAASAQTAGSILKAQDTNDSGNDDAIGNVLLSVSSALFAFTNGNDKGVRKGLKAAADGIYAYLGLTTPTESVGSTVSKTLIPK